MSKILAKVSYFCKNLFNYEKNTQDLAENELENVIDNMMIKTIIEYHQRNKSYTVYDFTDDTVLAEQTQDTDENVTQTPYQDNENLTEEKQLQDERYEVTDNRGGSSGGPGGLVPHKIEHLNF